METAVARPHSTTVTDVDPPVATMTDGLKSEFVQLESGTFTARWRAVRCGAIVVQFGVETLAVARRMRVPDDRWAFVVPLTVPGAARWNGLVVNGSELIVCAPRSEGYAFDPGGMHFAVISISPATSLALAESAVAIASAAQSCVIRPPAAALGALRDDLLEMERSAAGRPLAERDQARRGDRINARLAECLSDASGSVRTPSSRSAIVGRAEAFFRTHVGEPVSIAQLSAVAEVSERSLRNAFYRVYSISPKRYLRLWQLHQVHSALRADGQPETTVTGAATDCGFYELGRFAGEYKALFGEAPSQTLHRTRLRNAARGAA